MCVALHSVLAGNNTIREGIETDVSGCGDARFTHVHMR